MHKLTDSRTKILFTDNFEFQPHLTCTSPEPSTETDLLRMLLDTYLPGARSQSGWSVLPVRWHSHSCNSLPHPGGADRPWGWAAGGGIGWPNTEDSHARPEAAAVHP